MNCIIIDDDEFAIEIIQSLCKLDKSLHVKASFSNAIEAIKYLSENHGEIDFIFLDIHMPSFTGFELIKTLNIPLKIILITGDKSLAVNAFEYNYIIDYLTKPIDGKRFLKAIDKLRKINIVEPQTEQRETSFSEKIFVNINKKLVGLDLAEINFIEAKGDYIVIHTNANNLIVHSSLKKIQDVLPEKTFVKVHRSFVVNIEKIVDIEDYSILINKNVIPISRSQRKVLMEYLTLL
ncbi:MAG: LytR/AlgR family response regulator transcription factor [Flavobacteriaceae bacterium]